MAAYPGAKGMVYMSTTGAGVATAVLQMNHWTINKTTDKHEVTPFGSANKTFVQGFPDVSGTISGFWNDLESKPFTGATSSTGVNLYLYPSTDAPSKFHSGPAWIDLSMDTSTSGAVSISMNFAANGSWASTF